MKYVFSPQWFHAKVAHPGKVGDLQGIKIMEKIKPAFKFSGHAGEITFGKFIKRLGSENGRSF
jgi:hypothetical protein